MVDTHFSASESHLRIKITGIFHLSVTVMEKYWKLGYLISVVLGMYLLGCFAAQAQIPLPQIDISLVIFFALLSLIGLGATLFIAAGVFFLPVAMYWVCQDFIFGSRNDNMTARRSMVFQILKRYLIFLSPYVSFVAIWNPIILERNPINLRSPNCVDNYGTLAR